MVFLPGVKRVLTTKGDLQTYDTAYQKLAVGTNGYVLQADSTAATGIKWAAPLMSIYLSAGGGIGSTATPATGPTAAAMSTNKNAFYYLAFAAGSATYADWAVVMPANYGGGTVTAKPFFYAPSGTMTNGLTVIFNTAAVSYGNSETLDAAMGTGQTSTYTLATDVANDLLIGPTSAAITIGGTPAAGELVIFRVNRSAADTFASAVNLIGLKIFYQTNSITE